MLPANDEGLDATLDGVIGDGENDGLMELESAGVGGEESKPVAAGGLCSCLTVGYYQPYFDIDTVDVYRRLKSTVTFMKDEETFLTSVSTKPDAYGPFWTATTLIFIISATSNISRYLAKGYNYDFELVSFCMSFIYGYLVVLATALWAAFTYFVKLPVRYMSLMCLVGYSFALYIPCTILATFSVLSWPSIVLAGVGSTLFVLKSIVPALLDVNVVISARKEKAVTVLSLLVAAQAVFMLIIKFKFYSHSS